MSSLARVFATAALLALGACRDDSPAIAPEHVGHCRTFARETVRWLISGDSIGRPFLDAYCAGVGPSLLLRADSTAATPDTLVVINWNMALGEGRLTDLVNDLRDGAITGQRVEHFALLLQEAPRSDSTIPASDDLPDDVKASELDMFGTTDIVAFATAQRLHMLYVPSMRNGTGRQDQGNAILSTLPLHDAEVYELAAGIRRRVAVSAVIQWPAGGQLRLVSVHLDNWSPRRFIGSLGSVRARQARTLAAMLPAGEHLLLGGDLNTWTRGTNEQAFLTLRRLLPRPDTLDLRPTADRVGGPKKLDYLMLRAPAAWHFTERRVENRYDSDHNPIVGILIAPR
jgi:endonuclease/exonuclease/phosphatase family metal-dependent hydrolase